MSEVKQVKVDNWGVYFLQRLKHFFNRTDFCDLTLQFQDNAQLKVHRLVLSACTEYFELLERTCEMYEDCLVMPDDLQADVVVPIVNFMYTGQLEFRMDLLERLYQTSQIMKLPVLTKLLEAHRQTTPKLTHCYTGKRKSADSSHHSTPSTSHKRSYSKAFDNHHVYRDRTYHSTNKEREETIYSEPSSSTLDPKRPSKKLVLGEPRPTRYELPEELDSENIFDSSFCNISYTSKPLMVHPETVKRYSSKRSALFGEPSSSKKFLAGTSTMDIVECKKIVSDNIFEDSIPEHNTVGDMDMFSSFVSVKNQPPKDTNQLFDQILDQNDSPKITIDTKNSKAAANLDHAKIISEVLKKYSHLLKGSKNIKLKILHPPTKSKKQKSHALTMEEKALQIKNEEQDLTYETDVIDSQQAAKLIAMGAENIKGPWICLICGTPGRALHFTTYYKFRRHLVDVHNEKPVVNICEYCGHKALKRNYLLHHLFSKHGIAPPPQYKFPKCNQCNYIALTEGFLVKHKLTHSTEFTFRCNVCPSQFSTSNQLLQHIQNTGHKYSADRKNNLQCIYCLKVFLRENNLFAHLKTHHKNEAKSDGIIEDSDEEKPRLKNDGKIDVKFEPPANVDNEYEDVDVQYQIQADGNIHVISNKKSKPVSSKAKQTILNPDFGGPKTTRKTKTVQNIQPQHVHNEFLQDISVAATNSNDEEVVTIDNNEYILRDNEFLPRKMKPQVNEEYIISDIIDPTDIDPNITTVTPTTSVDFRGTHSENYVGNAQASVIINKPNVNQPIRFVVSNEEEYKALMSANHPIIFDNGDTNKTLTVLTAPHTTTLDTATIDLDNTQPNDMMIIQDNYPLNVSEAIQATDNSNIVVVYSHAVDSQNKQFQLITTQGLEAQFVQSSAIIAQNYETVTTSAPVVNAQIVNSQEVWQNEVHQTLINHDVPTTEDNQVTTVSHRQDAEIRPIPDITETETQCPVTENEVHLSDLPEVELLNENTKEVAPETCEPNEILQNNQNEAYEVPIVVEQIIEPMEQDISEEIPCPQPPSDIETESNIPSQKVVETNIGNIKANEIISYTDSVIKEASSNEISNVVEKETEITTEISQLCEVQENHQEEIIESTEQTLSPTYTQVESMEINVGLSEQSEIVDAQSNITEDTELTTPVVVPSEKIKDLTSEWSEDEYDVPEPNVENENINKEQAQSDTVIAEPRLEVEESIENIQQEVDKHLSIATEDKIQTEVNGNASQNSLTLDTDEPKEIKENTNPSSSREKISSLLNDWEDNDSQEDCSKEDVENKQSNEKEDDTIQNNPQETEKVNEETQDAIKPEDNIKSLVSDWDDDEEEIKK